MEIRREGRGVSGGKMTFQDFAALSAGEFVRTRWWWVRHAPVRATGGRIYGQSDPPCDCSDRPVFERLARILPRGAVWFASHLRRAHQTAAAIWEAGYGDGIELRSAEALAEQHLGDWQGMDRAAFFADRRPAPGSYWFARADEKAPGGESFAEVVLRVREAVAAITAECAGRDIVAVAHGGSIRAALAVALGIEPQGALGIAIENCSLTRLDHYQGKGESGWRVAMVNHQPWMDGREE